MRKENVITLFIVRDEEAYIGTANGEVIQVV